MGIMESNEVRINRRYVSTIMITASVLTQISNRLTTRKITLEITSSSEYTVIDFTMKTSYYTEFLRYL
jgi:hypothetical protein